jgi:hypothetical protein
LTKRSLELRFAEYFGWEQVAFLPS